MSVKVDLVGDKELKKQLKQLMKIIPNETLATLLEVAFVDIETFAKDKANIPVNTGRLRASLHTKYKRKPKESTLPIPSQQTNFRYSAEGELFDGTLSEPIDENTIIVGTNVEYAKRINRLGGGGPNSRRKLPKGQGQAFFDKAVNNGYVSLKGRLVKLAKKIEKRAGEL